MLVVGVFELSFLLIGRATASLVGLVQPYGFD